LLLLRQKRFILALQMPHLPMLFVADTSLFSHRSRRTGSDLPVVMADLLIETSAQTPDTTITIVSA